MNQGWPLPQRLGASVPAVGGWLAASWGAGGRTGSCPGATSESGAERLPDKCTVKLRAGDVLRMLTSGGGGDGAEFPRDNTGAS